MNNNYDQFDNYLINNSLNQNNRLKHEEIEEQRLMRKAYCKVNNIPYEEPTTIPSFGKGFLKVFMILVFLYTVGFGLSVLIGEPNFIKFLSLFF